MARLDTTQWLDHALGQLAEHGYGALKAQSLARGLGVTRGSFYWHFESLEAFQRALISHWSEVTTDRLIASLDQDEGDPADRLRLLLRRTLRSGERLERAIRSWATVEPHVAALVNAVDLRRIGYAEALLTALGVPAGDVSPRARLLYWAAIGRLMMPVQADHALSDAEIDRLADLAAAP